VRQKLLGDAFGAVASKHPTRQAEEGSLRFSVNPFMTSQAVRKSNSDVPIVPPQSLWAQVARTMRVCLAGWRVRVLLIFLAVSEVLIWTRSNWWGDELQLYVSPRSCCYISSGPGGLMMGYHVDSVATSSRWRVRLVSEKEHPISDRAPFELAWHHPDALGGFYYLRVPHWSVLLFLWIWLVGICLVRLRRLNLENGRCCKCGYDLRGSQGRCPECGTPFDPATRKRVTH